MRRIAAVLASLPFLMAPILDGEITGPEKFSSAACSSGQTFVKGASVWACGSGVPRTYLGADVTEATGAAYTTIFTVPLTMTTGKEQVLIVHLIQSLAVSTTDTQNRVQISAANATGTCTFVSQTSTAFVVDAIDLTTTSADTGNITGAISTNPQLSTIHCAISASNTNATNAVVDFQSEGTDTVTTHAGSWYELVVN